MTDPQDLFEAVARPADAVETPFTVVAECWRCGARSEPIVQQGEFDKPHLWAVIALAEHDREMHPETITGEDAAA